jgi:hypothetical protein
MMTFRLAGAVGAPIWQVEMHLCAIDGEEPNSTPQAGY